MKKIFLFLFMLMATNVPLAYSQLLEDGNSSANVPGPADEAGVQGNGTQPGQNNTGANVNTFTGDAEATATDFSYSRNGFPLKFERYFHNGITSPIGEMGRGWMSNYDVCLFVPMPNSNGDHAILVMPHQAWRFSTSDGGNTFAPPHGCFYQLQNVNGTYVLADKTGVVMKFQVLAGGEPNIARLVEMDDLNGNQVILTYQACTFYYENDVQAYYDYNNHGTHDFTNTYNSSDQSLRLETVTGPNNNWSINFHYYDSTSSPATFFQYTGNDFYTVNATLYWLQAVYTDYTNMYANRLQSITNSVGDAVTFDSGSQAGPVTQVSRSPSSLNASYQYYTFVNNLTGSSPTTVVTLKQIIDPLAKAGYRNITYVSDSNPSSINNPVRQIRNALGQVMYSYDYSTEGSGNKVASTSGPNGLIESDVYSPAGAWLQKRFVTDGHPYTESYVLNSDFLPTNIVDGNGNATTMAYDSIGNMIYQQDAEGYSIANIYDNNIGYPININGAAGFYYSRLSSNKDKNNVARNYTYDSSGNLTRVSVAGIGAVSIYGYSFSNGSLVQKTVMDANSHTITYNFDANGNIGSIQEPNVGPPENLTGAITSFAYDTEGRNFLVSKNDPLTQTTTYTYNSKLFLSSVQYPDSTTEQYLYDNDGDVTSLTDRKGTVSTFSYDQADRLTDSYRGGVKHTKVNLDAIGNQISLVDNRNQKTIFNYNEQNKIRSTIDPIGVGYTNTYDGVLNMISSKDSRGVIKKSIYFKNGRLKLIQFSDGTPSISYTYDGNGNRTSMTDGVGLKTYTYNVLNHLLSVADIARNFNLTYTYDLVGNRLSEQSNKISGTNLYSYYENNQLKTFTDIDGAATTYVYDGLKNPQNVFYPNGAIAIYFFDYTNHTNRLTALQTINSHQEIISRFSYTYDGVGNVTGATDLSGSTSFGYDNLYQLTSATYPGPQSLVGYTYDGVGNRTGIVQNGVTQAYSNDSGNQLNSISGSGGESFSYDLAGNMTSRSSGYNYSWDAMNRLVKVVTPSGTITFVYDGNDHRVQKIAPSGTTEYFYDGNTVIFETDGSANILKTFGSNIEVKDQKGNKFFYLLNGHGDTSGLMDVFQNVVTSYFYDAFGSVLGNVKDANNRRYVGQLNVYSDDDIGLQYMYHRWYDPKIGRFISRDPIGLRGGLNLYDYCNNNPLIFVDPDGKFLWFLVPIFVGFVEGLVVGSEAGLTGWDLFFAGVVGGVGGIASDALGFAILGADALQASWALLATVSAITASSVDAIGQAFLMPKKALNGFEIFLAGVNGFASAATGGLASEGMVGEEAINGTRALIGAATEIKLFGAEQQLLNPSSAPENMPVLSGFWNGN